MKLLAITDLCDRWKYTKVGIYKLSKRTDFPKPTTTVCRGRIKLFSETDIEAYEKGKPWLFDENYKRQRQKLYFRLQLIEESDPQKSLNKIFGPEARPWKKMVRSK